MASRQAYNATIDLQFDKNGERTPIESEKIIYVMIEHDYIDQVLPIIYITLAVSYGLYADILKYKDTAKFYLSIQKNDKTSNLGISKTILSGMFNYIPSSMNPNYREHLKNDINTDIGSYMRLMIGLVSIDLTNVLRKSFNGVYQNIDQNTLIAMALEDTNCVIEKIAYNKEFSSIVIPPVSSRYKFLEFIFNKNNFYDTLFRYYMDFDRSYLLSKCGEPVDAEDGDLSSVIIDIRSATDAEAYYNGIEIKNGAYYVYINPAEANVTLNEGTEKVANQLVSVNNEEVQTLDLDINNSEGSDTKQMFVRQYTSNAALYKNEMEMDTVIIEVLKKNIDGSIFTPNKEIIVNNLGEYSKYNGKYILVYKREFFKCVAGEFILSCVLGLKKLGNIVPAGSTEIMEKSKYVSGGARKKSTSNTKTNTVPATKKK